MSSTSLYWSTHRAIERVRGSASTHQCECGAPAKDWAYQHNAGERELVENGFAFSLDPSDYAPMCRSCHQVLDQTGVKIGPSSRATQLARLESEPAFREMKTDVARRVTAARVARAEQDPEFAERLRRAAGSGGAKVAHMRRKCGGCEMESHPVGIGKHQKASGHTGWTVVD